MKGRSNEWLWELVPYVAHGTAKFLCGSAPGVIYLRPSELADGSALWRLSMRPCWSWKRVLEFADWNALPRCLGPHS